MYELIAGQPLLEVAGLEGYQARLAALHTMDLQVCCLCRGPFRPAMLWRVNM